MPYTDLKMHERVPSSLRNDFWQNVLEAFEEEFKLIYQEKHNPLINVYNVDEMEVDRLREISRLLGVEFDSTVNDSVEFLRREVENIPFKVGYKSTAVLYKSFPKALGRIGQLFLYFYKASSEDILRNSENILLALPGHDYSKPILHESRGDFTGFFEDPLRLDTNLTLDPPNEEEIWTLDTVDSEISSNHIGIELFIDRVMEKDVFDVTGASISKEFLMTWEPLDFIMANLDFARRAIEVPHVGSQLSIILDPSGNVLPHGGSYTMPDIKLNGVILPDNLQNLNSVFEVGSIEFGIGSHDLFAGVDSSGYIIDDSSADSAIPPSSELNSLETRVAKNSVLFDERYEDGDWFGVISEYRGQEINNFVLHNENGYQLNDSFGTGTVDGVNTSFKGQLLFPPVQKGNLRFTYTHNDTEIEILDDRGGNLITGADGTIDYQTGQYIFNTFFEFKNQVSIGTGDGVETEFTSILPLPTDAVADSEGNKIISNPANPRVWITFSANNKRFAAQDDGNGNITHELIDTGTIDYTNGDIYLLFTTPIVTGTDILVEYVYERDLPPDAGTEIKVDYYFTEDPIEITEAGIFDQDNNMVAYATFPPIEFISKDFHVNVAFLLKKTLF
jgi:hypothetical protein